MGEVIRIGIAASFKPTRGKLGLLGLHGCRHWGNWINKAGGLLLGGRSYSVDINYFDCGYNPQKSIKCSQHHIFNKYVLLLLMLGGATLLLNMGFCDPPSSAYNNTAAK